MVFAQYAKAIIVEINLAQPELLEGIHDLYEPGSQGERSPIPLTKPDDRIGSMGIPVDIEKIKGIVFTNQLDSPSTIVAPDEETVTMAQHLIAFLRQEIEAGRLTNRLAPLQSGIGSVANAVFHGLLDSEFTDLEVISINTALELDIYGNVNSTHIMGTQMMNGIGGSGDFARNARLGIFVTKSIAKDGKISSIVPFVSHVDHTEHDVDVIVTEQGYADLRGLAPRERAELIIERCAHPMYREQLTEYYQEALKKGGQTPHDSLHN